MIVRTLQELLIEIDGLKKRVHESRPLPQETLESIRKDWMLRWTYNSNAIEGNTLTLLETKVVIEDGITIGGKMLREHFEAINHRDAIEYVEDVVKGKEPFSGIQIRNIHQLILKNIVY